MLNKKQIVRRRMPQTVLAALVLLLSTAAAGPHGVAEDPDALTAEVMRREYGESEERSRPFVNVFPAPRPQFEPLAIPLAPALQQHAWELCHRYETPVSGEELFYILLAIMHHESRYRADVPDNINHNGSRDRGLMQINSVNWGWLWEEHALDVDDPADNIEAAVVILAGYLQHYPTEQSLAAYAAGEAGMLSGGGMWFADEILERVRRRPAPQAAVI